MCERGNSRICDRPQDHASLNQSKRPMHNFYALVFGGRSCYSDNHKVANMYRPNSSPRGHQR